MYVDIYTFLSLSLSVCPSLYLTHSLTLSFCLSHTHSIFPHSLTYCLSLTFAYALFSNRRLPQLGPNAHIDSPLGFRASQHSTFDNLLRRMIKANIQIHVENETIKVNDSDHTLKGEEISSKLKLHEALQRKVQNKSWQNFRFTDCVPIQTALIAFDFTGAGFLFKTKF